MRFNLSSLFSQLAVLGYTVYSTMESRHVFTVSELNSTARTMLEQHVGTVWVQGEVTDLSRAPSGHVYFTLKDENSQISAVRFKSRSSLLAPVSIEPGMVVLAQGTLTVYEPRGRYQFIVTILQPLGAGALQLAFERLKRKLQDEGLFSPETKVELPTIPSTIGVITSSKGAALRDIHSVLERRWPQVRVILFPSSVQGASAPQELRAALAQAIHFSQSTLPLDVLILTRGGGSAEDLAAFNDEALARDLFNCPIPTISAVGHEIDFSITDFVADRRSPTPSAAAEMAVPDRADALGSTAANVQRIIRQIRSLWRTRADELRLRTEACLLRSPTRRFETYEQRLDLGLSAMIRNMSVAWKHKQDIASHWSEILRLSDPALPLQRGYSVTVRLTDGRPIRSISTLSVGEPIQTRLVDGVVLSHIEEVAPHEA